MTRTEVLLARFLDSLACNGSELDPEWLAAFRDVPRSMFVPSFFRHVSEGSGWALVEQPSDEWREGVYSNRPLITQLDGDDSLADSARAGGTVRGTSTSSSSAPSLMALMLDALDVRDKQRILEIGTGTGYNAALLCHRLGAANVTSVDIDRAIVDRARRRLAALSYRPHLEATDGLAGCPSRAPFDRVIGTVATPGVPAPWIKQASDGGRLLVALDRRNCGGLLAVLTVRAGSAEGRFLPDYGGFMPVRSVRSNAAEQAFRDIRADEGDRRGTGLPADVVTDESSPFEFFAALTVPGGGWNHLGFVPDDGQATETWIATGTGSWVCHSTDAAGRHTVWQGGPSRLWDDVERAHDEWERLGRPVRERFGLSVSAAGKHTVWLDQPAGPRRWLYPPH